MAKQQTPNADRTDSSDITPLENELLDNAGLTEQEQAVAAAAPDATDEDGEPLNENPEMDIESGSELDIPEDGADTGEENSGEDEENEGYSSIAGDED